MVLAFSGESRCLRNWKDIRGGEHILYLYELADTADGWMTFHRTFFIFRLHIALFLDKFREMFYRSASV